MTDFDGGVVVTIADVLHVDGNSQDGQIVFCVVVDGPAGFQTLQMTQEEIRKFRVMEAFFASDLLVLPPTFRMIDLGE